MGTCGATASVVADAPGSRGSEQPRLAGIFVEAQRMGFAERISEDDTAGTFRHEALFYAGDEDFLRRTGAFIQEGVALGEPVLVLVRDPKLERLRSELGDAAAHVTFVDMADVGRNPARIIPVWREFVEAFSAGSRVRGIGEPIWAGRTRDELEESQRYESLINLAFAGVPAWIVCPYDLDSLDETVIDEACRSHPIVTSDGSGAISATYRPLEDVDRPFGVPFSKPPPEVQTMVITLDALSQMRLLTARRASGFGLPPDRVQDIVLSVNEVATNSLVHARGCTTLRTWADGDELVFEIADSGSIDDPLVGRARPVPGQAAGYGLWMANQLCDLVQVRSFDTGSAVRLRMARR